MDCCGGVTDTGARQHGLLWRCDRKRWPVSIDSCGGVTERGGQAAWIVVEV